MINKVEGETLMLKQFRSFQLRLLDVTTLPEIIDFVLDELKIFFSLDDICLSLIDQDKKLEAYLNSYDFNHQQHSGLVLLEDDLVLLNELGSGAHIGGYDNNKHEVFFPLREKIPTTIAIMPLNRNGNYIGSLNLASKRDDCFFNSVVNDYMDQVIALISIALENSFHFEVVKQIKLTESLADVNNRHFLEQRLTEELDRSRRSINCVSCLVLDIVFSKGRKANAQKLEQHVLKSVAELLKQQLRISDVFSYYEGKKFAALLMNASDEIVLAIAQRIKSALAAHKVNFAGQSVSISVTIGHASCQISAEATQSHQELAEQLIAEADTNLLSH